MRKDDIIGQKLFETCKLSEFYLNLVVKCTNDDESPIQLARAYKQKLYEIVERYDRLLDANRQRQQLSLTLLDSNKHSRRIYQESNLMLTRTSTPSKTPNTMTPSGINSIFNYQQQQTPTQSLTPSSSFASTPTTPYYQHRNLSFQHKQNSFTQPNGRSFTNSHNSTKYQTTQKSNNKQSNLQSQQLYHSSLNKTNKLLQQYAYLYDEYDSADYDDDDETTTTTETTYYTTKNSHNNKYNTITKTTPTSTSTGSLNCKLNYETYSNTFNKLVNKTNNTVYQDETVEEYEEDVDVDEEDDECEEDFNNDLNESQIIEKSYSNLSKDSGVFADSYHSDYSNCLIGLGNTTLGEQNIKSKKQINKQTSQLDLTNKTLDSNNEENKTIISQDENDTVCDDDERQEEDTKSSKLIWGSITRLVETTTFNEISQKNKSKFMSSTPINRPTNQTTNDLTKTEINYDFNDNQNSIMIMDTNSQVNDYLSCYSTSSASSSNTMSPMSSSSPTSSTSITNTNINSITNNKSNLIDDRLTISAMSKELQFLNTNSLMNVSMLDNIQATNTHIDFDNMNSSILMFN